LMPCSAKAAGVDAFDETGRLGLLHVAFPLKMMLQPDGHLTSSDLLHTTAGAIIFDVYENQDARLVSLQIPDKVLRTFPGPAYGPAGLRRATNLTATEPAFGTILKPTAGITPTEVEALVAQVAACRCSCSSRKTKTCTPTWTTRRWPSAPGWPRRPSPARRISARGAACCSRPTSAARRMRSWRP
jgi:hypothetical protein